MTAFRDRLRDSAFYRQARGRLKRVDPMEVFSWANTSLWAVQSDMELYLRTKDRAALEEARKGAVGLLAAVDDLLDRQR